MTDTARTLAAIKALFANNSVGAISPQDLRDFVESIANPITDGFQGLGASIEEQCFSAYRISTNGTDHLAGVYDIFDSGSATSLPTNIPSGTHFVGWEMRVKAGDRSDAAVWDPAAYVDPNPWGPESYWGITHPAYTTLLLPAGIYNYGVRVDVLGAALDTDSMIQAAMDYAEPFTDVDTFTSIYQLTNENNKIFASSVNDTRYYVNGSIAVSQPTHFTPEALVSSTPNALKLAACQVWVFRVR